MPRFAVCLSAAGLLAGASAVPVSAVTTTITVTVNQFLNTPWVIEGETNAFAIASFTDANACTAPGVCNPGSAYTASIDWGDNTAHTFGAVSDVVSQTGNTGTYNVSDNHQYPDEFNCPNPGPPPTSTCGFKVQVQVTNTIDTVTKGGGCPPYPVNPGPCVAVKDQPLDQSFTPSGFTAYAGVNYAGQIGSFHDENNKTTALDGGGEEFIVLITDWGDGTVITPPGDAGGFTIDGCGASPGPAVGQGCNILVNAGGGHTYAATGTHTVKVSIGDGSNLKTLQFTTTAHVLLSRAPVNQVSGAAPQGRGPVHQSGSVPPPGPRFPAQFGWFVPQPRDFVDTARTGVLLVTTAAGRPVYRYTTAL